MNGGEDLLEAEYDGEGFMAMPKYLGVPNRVEEEGEGVVDKFEGEALRFLGGGDWVYSRFCRVFGGG